MATNCPSPPFFWNWFRKVLRWPFLLVGGPLEAICKGVAESADVVLKDIHWLNAQFNPATCEIEYVDRFGSARGLTRHYRENDEMWRRRVCAAHAWHKLAGTTMGMPKILAHYGYTGAVMFNRAKEGEPELWAHFRVEFGGEYPVSDEDYELVRWILSETKPAKSVLESVTLVISPKATVYVAIGSICGQVVTLEPYRPAVHESSSKFYVSVGGQSWSTITIEPKAE